MIFLDTSVVLAYYLPEAHTEHVRAIYQENLLPTISDLVELEMVAALSRLARVQIVKREDAYRVLALFTSHLEEGFYRRLHLSTDHFELARQYVAGLELPLKAPDALHLAVAGAENLRIVTADRQMASNANALSLKSELIRS